MTTRRPGGRPRAVRNGATSSATATRISSAIGPPSRSRAPPDPDTLTPARAPGSGRAARRGRRLPGVSAASRSTSWTSSSTRAVISSLELRVADRRQVDEHVGGRAAGGRLAEQRGDVEVARGVDVAPPGQGLGHLDDGSRQASTHVERDLGGVARGRLQRGRPGRLLRRRSRGAASSPPRSRRRPRRPRRRASGTGRRGRWPDRRAQARRSACSAYFGRPWDSAATIATSPAPRLAATAEALPPPGTGSAEASRATNASRVRSRKRRMRRTARPDCRYAGGVAAERVHPAREPDVGQVSETGRARYRRTRPATDGGPTRRGGLPVGPERSSVRPPGGSPRRGP